MGTEIKQALRPVVTPNATGPRLMGFEEQGQDDPQVLSRPEAKSVDNPQR